MEPRAAHAAERDPPLPGAPHRRAGRPASGGDPPEVSAADPHERPAPAGPHQRHPRPVQDRGRADGAAPADGVDRGGGRPGGRDRGAAGRAEEDPPRERRRRCRRGRGRRPQGQADAAEPGLEPDRKGNAALPLVLVVEDDPPASELLTRQLERAGFRTEIVRSGADAVSHARQSKPVAITLDILLPGLDGWEVLTRLKQDPVTSSIPVVVFSVVDSPELTTALDAGGNSV